MWSELQISALDRLDSTESLTNQLKVNQSVFGVNTSLFWAVLQVMEKEFIN